MKSFLFCFAYWPFVRFKNSSKSLINGQGPTVSPVFCKNDGRVSIDYYAMVICVPKKVLYKSVQQLRAVSHFLSDNPFRCDLVFVISPNVTWRTAAGLDSA